MGAVLLAVIFRKGSEAQGPSFDALNRTIEDLNEESD